MVPARDAVEKVADAAPVRLAVGNEAVMGAGARAQAAEALLREAGARVAGVRARVDEAHERAVRVKAVGVAALVCRPARSG